MTEIKKTLAILKARWPEVILLIGLAVLLPFLSKLLANSALSSTVLSVGFLLPLMVIRTMLRLGFLRTVYLEGQQRQTIAVLLRTGLPFFWRMIVLGLLFSIPLLTLMLLSIHIAAKRVAPGEAGILHNISLIRQLLVLVINIIVMKFILLLPALVIVLDCRVFESFKFLKKCRLRDAGTLIVLFCFKMAFPCLWMLSRTLYGTTTAQPIFRIVSSTTTCFIGLIIAVMAVRFVASLDLVYDAQTEPLDSQGLLKS